MAAHPEDQPGVAAVPGGAAVPAEEAPRFLVVLVAHQDAHPPLFAAVPPSVVADPRRRGPAVRYRGRQLRQRPSPPPLVLLPHHREEQGTRTVHHRDVGEPPVAVVRD